jgi:hypothetical protein
MNQKLAFLPVHIIVINQENTKEIAVANMARSGRKGAKPNE